MKFNLGTFSIEVIQRPGSLPGRRREALLSEVVRIALDAFGKTTRETMERRFLPADEILLMKRGRRIVGYAMNRYFRFPTGGMLYLAGSAIEKRFENKGLYSVLRPLSILLASSSRPFSHVSTRTQNPIVYASLEKLGAHPRIGKPVPASIRAAAQHLAQTLNPDKEFDVNALVVKKAFHSSASVTSPKHRDAAINEFVSSRINEDQGDAMLIVGKFNKRKTTRLLVRAASRMDERTARQVRRLARQTLLTL